MAKFELFPGETMVGSGQMSLFLKQGLTRKPFQGNIFVTNRRVCFKISMMRELEMDLPVEEVKGFKVDHALLVTRVTSHSRNGDTYPLTVFPARKLQGWLKEIGIQELS